MLPESSVRNSSFSLVLIHLSELGVRSVLRYFMKTPLPLITVLACAAFSANAAVTLPAIFSDHAVLQKSEKVPVWGKADANEKVTVTLDKATASTVTGADGKWKVLLNLKQEGQGPYELIVEGTNKLTFTDVLIGEVWVCAGQSNMWHTLGESIGGKEEIQSSNPTLRQFWVDTVALPAPREDAKGGWAVFKPGTAPYYSGVGYFFGKKIQNELKTPVGLIHSCWGGTPVEAWTSAEALDTVPELKEGKDKAVASDQNFYDFVEKYKAWAEKYHRKDHPLPEALDPYIAPDAPTTDWKPVKLPAKFSEIGLPDAGTVWLRKKITLPPQLIKKDCWVSLGDCHDSATLFWNGKKINEKDITNMGQGFGPSANDSPSVEVTIAIRISNPSTGMRILPGKPFLIRSSNTEIPLEGEWLAKVENELPPLDAEAKADLPVQPPFPAYEKTNTATFLFNGMVHPIIPYGIAGVIWYQGEANCNRAFQYRTAFPLLINDWHKKWGQGDFPFYFCQLANFNNHTPTPGDNDWAELREAQDMALALPNTAEAILIDIGEEGSIHPRNKKDAGERLALNALAKTYGKKVVSSGPAYDSMKIEGDKIRLKFKNTDGGLVARQLPASYTPNSLHPEITVPLVRNTPDSEVEGFAICGNDHKFVWANAKIEGSDIIVSADSVTTPVAVRYAWASNPFCNLYNGAGLPAGPFRTDNLPCTTEKNRY